MAKLVFSFGVGKSNDVEMLPVMIDDINKDNLYKQKELVNVRVRTKSYNVIDTSE